MPKCKKQFHKELLCNNGQPVVRIINLKWKKKITQNITKNLFFLIYICLNSILS